MTVRKRLGEILIEAKKITKDQLRQGLAHQSTHGGKIGEALLHLGYLNEEALFLTLSKQLKIPVIPEDKFARLTIEKEALKLIPRHFAEENLVFPIQFDDKRNSISLAMVDPTDSEILNEIKILCQSEKVKRYLAQKSTILGAIKRYYQDSGAGETPSELEEDTALGFKQSQGNTSPNTPLHKSRGSYNTNTDTSLNPDIAAEIIAEDILEDITSATPATPPPKAKLAKIQLEKRSREITIDPAVLAPTPEKPKSSPPTKKPAPLISIPVGEHRILLVEDKSSVATAAERILTNEGYQTTVAHGLEDAAQCLKTGTFDVILLKSNFADAYVSLLEAAHFGNPYAQIKIYSNLSQSLVGEPITYDQMSQTFFQTIDCLVSFMERKDPGFRNYALTIARYSRLVAQRLGLSRLQVDEIFFSAYLQDLWKVLIEPEKNEEEVDASEKRRSLIEIFSDMNCPYHVVPIVQHISEFFNGKGQPSGLKGNDIPLGSRIISVVRAFEEMIRSNLITGVQEVGKVSKLLRKGANIKFDPKCVEALVQVLEGESFLENVGVQPIGGPKENILLVDKDPQTTSLVELRLINEGYSVKVARDGQQAWRLIESEPPAMILSDVVLPKIDGFNLCEMVRSNEKTKDIPFIFVSSRADDFNMTKGLEMGATDYLTKPVNVPFLITKVRKIMESVETSGAQPVPTQTDGVAGSLSQMGLVEIIQILGGGTKTAFLKIVNPDGAQADLYMERGKIVGAFVGDLKGEEAFYELLTWVDGTFSIHNDETTDEKNINQSTDFLLLEGMRRMDEAAAGHSAMG